MATQVSSSSRSMTASPDAAASARISARRSPSTKGGKYADVAAGRASFSPDRLYRYALWRTWDDTRPQMMVIGLNPSTADETKLDPTLKRCIDFARSWGYGGFAMANLFAYRATQPRDMMSQDDPVGPDNDRWLIELAFASKLVLAAWGTHGGWFEREQEVIELLCGRGINLACLGLTNDGYPKHPLARGKAFVPRETLPAVFRRGSVRG